MLTDGKYFEKYIKNLPIKKSERERNALLSSVIKKLGSNKKFEKHILNLRKRCLIPKNGYMRDPNDENRLIGYNYSAEIERVADDVGTQFEKWYIPIDLRNILAGFVLCNEPLYLDARMSKATTKLNNYSIEISFDMPINSKTELKRYIDSIWSEIEDHQSRKGYKKKRKRTFSTAERNTMIRDLHEQLLKIPLEKRKYPDDIAREIENALENVPDINIGYDSIRSIIHRR